MEPPWLVAGHRASGWSLPTGAQETLRLTTTVRLFSVLDQGQKSFDRRRGPAPSSRQVIAASRFDRVRPAVRSYRTAMSSHTAEAPRMTRAVASEMISR